MKLGDKIISKTNYVWDIWNPDCYLTTYAQLEEDMEGYVEEFISPDETILNFYGVSIVIETEDFANGNFLLVREVPKLELVTADIKHIKQ
jgi:hypothetical protein